LSKAYLTEVLWPLREFEREYIVDFEAGRGVLLARWFPDLVKREEKMVDKMLEISEALDRDSMALGLGWVLFIYIAAYLRQTESRLHCTFSKRESPRCRSHLTPFLNLLPSRG